MCIQLFRERLSEKMCTRQSRKVIWDMINTLFLTTVAVKPTWWLSFSTRKHNIANIPCHSFKFLWRTVYSKPPTIPFVTRDIYGLTYRRSRLEHVIMWHFELSGFSIENRFLVTVHLWANCNSVSEVLMSLQVYRFRSPLLLWNPIVLG